MNVRSVLVLLTLVMMGLQMTPTSSASPCDGSTDVLCDDPDAEWNEQRTCVVWLSGECLPSGAAAGGDCTQTVHVSCYYWEEREPGMWWGEYCLVWVAGSCLQDAAVGGGNLIGGSCEEEEVALACNGYDGTNYTCVGKFREICAFRN